jgi:hypothetical protein
MKLKLIAPLFALAATAATAQTTVYSHYENLTNAGTGSQQELHVGLGQTTKFGTFSGALVLGRLAYPSRDDTRGFELAYGNSYSLGSATLSGRAALGRQNMVDTLGGGFTRHFSYYSLGVEAGAPVAQKLKAFIGYRHVNGLNSEELTRNVFSGGVDYQLTSGTSVRVGYLHARQREKALNGGTLGITYRF